MKAVVVHFVLATLGLGAAYRVWSAPEGAEETDDASVVVVDCEPKDLASIQLTTEQGTFLIEKKTADGDAFWWGVVTRTPEKGDASSESFAVSSKIDEYFKVAAPMRAVRNLGEVDGELAKEIELADAKTQFALTCGDKSHTFDVGIAASGSADRYLRKQGGGPVYLVKRELIEKIERADSQLMQRQLTDHEDRDVENLVVKALGAEAKLLHHNRLDSKKAEWVDAAKPDQRNELYGNWLSRVGRLSISEYLAPEQKPGDEKKNQPTPSVPTQPDAGAPSTDAVSPQSDALTSIATLRYLDENGKLLGEVELARVGEDKADYYARSSATRAWVRVLNSVGRQVEGDLPMIVGLEEIPEAPPKPNPDALPAGHPPI